MTDSQPAIRNDAMSPGATAGASRRQVLRGAGALLGSLAMTAIVRAQSGPKIRIGYWQLWIAIHKGHYEKLPVMRSSGLASGLMACMSPIDPLVHFS